VKLQPETAEQIALIDWIKFQHPWLLKHTIHIPNERKCTKIYGFILKRMGLLKGASDLFIALPNSEYSGLFIEMKSAKGRPTPEQKEFIQLMNDTGYYACICYSAIEAIAVIKDYLDKFVKK
jgi:hypothetical protein